MAEENKNSAPTEEFNDDGTKNPTYVAPVVSESADDTKNKVIDDKGKKDDEGGEGEEKFDDTVDPTKPPTIPVRSNLQHIIARKNEKIKKLESKKEEGENKNDTENEGEGNEEDDKDLTPQAIKAIGKNVQKAIAPLMSKLASDADKAEFEELIRAEPDAAKYANHIKAYMEHDAYKGVSPVVIYHHLAFASANALGAKKKATADFEAKQNKSGGRNIVDTGTAGDLPSAEDIENMSDADFAKMEENALRGKFLKK